MSVYNLFKSSLWGRAEAVGLELDGVDYQFGEIERRSNRLANRLLEEGLKPGDRVAAYLKNSLAMIEAYLATIKAGLIFTPVNVLYRRAEIEHILSDAQPKVLFAQSESIEALTPLADQGPGVRLVNLEDPEESVENQSEEPPRVVLTRDTAAALVYTSGTTGRPKGAILTHGNFTANARNLVDAWRMTSEDRLLLALPLFHVHGLGNGLHTWLALGYRMRLLERFRKETILDELLDFRPTVFFGVPTMYERLLDAPRDKARRIGARMRLFVSGSAPLPAATLEKFRDLYGHVILERYGMSETLMNTSNPYEGERRPGSVGLPLPGVSIRVADPSTGVEIADGETGELLLRGPNVFSGYWRRPEATEEAFTADGYFRSGDLGVRSPDGYYTLQGRGKELIICGGFNVYPREVEEFLLGQPGVAEAAVLGEPDRIKGEVPAAYVVPGAAHSLDAEHIGAACREGLASFKVPRRFVFLEKLPRNALGKVQKHLLKQAATEQGTDFGE